MGAGPELRRLVGRVGRGGGGGYVLRRTGTDTGGSIRTPASFCGVVELKPTYGLVSIRGIIPSTYSLDHCGPLTRTVEDAAILLNGLAGYDRLDIASVEHGKEDYAAGMRQATTGLRVGIQRPLSSTCWTPMWPRRVTSRCRLRGASC